jgi:hypothetical protein
MSKNREQKKEWNDINKKSSDINVVSEILVTFDFD